MDWDSIYYQLCFKKKIMRKGLFMIAILILSSGAFGQALEKALTNTDKFSTKSGNLIEKDFNTIITFKRMDLQIMKVVNHTTGDSLKSLRLEYYYRSATNSYLTETKVGTVDKEELPDLIIAAKEMEEKHFKNTYKNYKEVGYKCNSDLKIGGYVDTGKSNIWVRYIKLENHNDSYVYFNRAEFLELIGWLEKINTLINEN
jgi:hypothetical protein